MTQVNLLQLDPRPNRESMYLGMFRAPMVWRLFGRATTEAFGTSTPVTANGIIVPMFIGDIYNAGLNVEDLTGIQMGNSTGTAGTEVSIIANQYFFFPPHGALTVPAQTIQVSIAVGTNFQNATNSARLTTITVELVKISANGTVTQLATATNATASSFVTGTTYRGLQRQLSLVVSSDLTLAATDRLAVRVSTTGTSSGAAGTVTHCVNAYAGGSVGAPLPSSTVGQYTTISMEVR